MDSISNDYDLLLSKTREKIHNFYKEQVAGWSVAINNENLKISSRHNEENSLPQIKYNILDIIVVKTWAILNGKPKDILEVISDINLRGEIDQNHDTGHIVKQIDQNTKIDYLRTKKILSLIISPRDVVYLSRVYQNDDTSFEWIGTSVIVPEAPEVQGYIRADLVFVGWFIKPIDENLPKRSEVQIISNTDPKGMMPKFLVNQGAKLQAQLITKLEDYLSKKNGSK